MLDHPIKKRTFFKVLFLLFMEYDNNMPDVIARIPEYGILRYSCVSVPVYSVLISTGGASLGRAGARPDRE